MPHHLGEVFSIASLVVLVIKNLSAKKTQKTRLPMQET